MQEMMILCMSALVCGTAITITLVSFIYKIGVNERLDSDTKGGVLLCLVLGLIGTLIGMGIAIDRGFNVIAPPPPTEKKKDANNGTVAGVLAGRNTTERPRRLGVAVGKDPTRWQACVHCTMSPA